MNSKALIHCDAVSVEFGAGDTTVRALRAVTLSVMPGELVVLRGASGSGKTTLLNVLGGLQAPTRGRVRIADVDPANAAEAALGELRLSRLGFVFQSSGLLSMLTAAENIEVPLRLAGTATAERDSRVRELLHLVGLAAHADQRPDELSGGQQQRIGIARALAVRPDILIADEPTSQLDSRTALDMMTMIAEVVRANGATAVVSTHDSRMDALADRIVEVRDGVVSEAPRSMEKRDAGTPQPLVGARAGTAIG